jgi:dTDP-glucose pyrophosphorylase
VSDLFERTLVPAQATLREAMRSLEDSGLQIALVVTDDRRLYGTITDGDLRRALLGGAPLDSPLDGHVNTDCFTVPLGAGRADVLELMAARHIAQVPEVDNDRVVVGLHLLNEMISPVERPNAAVIMVGGRGARLSPLTEQLPKPMLQVAGRPILERIVLHLVGSGIRQIYLSVNYLGELIEAHFEDGHRFGATIEYLRETEALGTAGSLALLGDVGAAMTNPFLVMNGDLVTQVNVGRMLDFHEERRQVVTMAVRRHYEQVPFGCVEVEGDRLVGFVEKPTTSRLINAGIYVVDPSCLTLITNGEAVSMPELIDRVRARHDTVRVFEIDEDWIDVGRPGELDRARRGE